MGFFDRFAAKKQNPPAPSTPPSSPASSEPVGSAGTTPPAGASGLNVKAQLLAAREKLEAKDLAAAMSIYEELLRVAGDRPDVLVALSADLGSCGYVEQIVELVAPRYDAEKHGPATGLNLLQAYLATRNTTAAQHLLDILFGLNRPELEERLYGFSNALADLLDAERRGQLAPAAPTNPSAPGAAADPSGAPKVISLISISKPIWAYGIEEVPGILPPPKADRVRRVAFGQLALLGTNTADLLEKPDDALSRFCRGFPLWMADTFYYSPLYAPIAAIGAVNKDGFAVFPSEWTAANLRELIATADRLDYVFTGALRHRAGDFELTLKVWEVKRFRERKAFTARWTPANAAAELTKLAETVRMFMEWAPYPAGHGLARANPADPEGWCDTLASSVSLFLRDKGVLAAENLESPTSALQRVGPRAAADELSSLAYLTLLDRAARVGAADPATHEVPLAHTPAVAEARGFLNL